jgi:hypothetical protein
MPLRRPPCLEPLEGRWLPSTFLVTTGDDAGPGSLRQAILDANAAPGPNEIDFAVGGGGAQTIRPTSPLPALTNQVVIDGTTQPGYSGSPLIDLDGLAAAPRGIRGLEVRGGDSTIKGMAVTNFRLNDPDEVDNFTPGLLLASGGNVVQGDYLGTDAGGTADLSNGIGLVIQSAANNRIGGTAPGEGNVISGNWYGVYFSGGSGNVVQGNRVGTDPTGTSRLANVFGVVNLGVNNLLGGTESGASNLISGNVNAGVAVSGSGVRVQGNTVGTDVTGTLPLGNGGHGVLVVSGNGHLVGGTEDGAGNRISANGGSGVYLGGTGSGDLGPGQLVEGNLIGTDAGGTRHLGNARDGVHIDGVNRGQDNEVAGNVIAYNGNDGVLVDRSTGNAVLGNAIFANGNLGIELLHGGNHDQPAPVLTAAATDGTSTTVTGTLTAAPGTTFTVEVYANRPGDPPGSGEVWLGSVEVTTDAAGHADFTATFAVAVDPGWFLTATATDPANNTSAFSAGVEVTP